MNVRGIQLSNGFIESLHNELLMTFSKHYEIELKTLTVFQLYGFGNYNDQQPNLKGFIIEKTTKWINGKYIYNKVREVEKGNRKNVKMRRDYLSLLIIAVGYDNYKQYLKESLYISDATREIEGENIEDNSTNENTLYYVGYYVENEQYFIKSKFTIHKMKTVSWELLYWERNSKPIFYTYFGKCVPTGESALSFYFNKENSSLNKECFVNLFYGNNMQSKPILLGAYCGFNRNNSPVIGKLILEQVNDKETQDIKVRSPDINPIFHHHLYSQRMEVESILPHKDSDLSVSINRLEIVNFLIGEYFGFYLDENNYLIPIKFTVHNDLGELTLKINNKSFEGIGRINKTENYLISEFKEKSNSYSQFSIQVKPLEKDLFKSYILVYSGADVLSGKVLLWKNNLTLEALLKDNKGFYLNISDVDTLTEEKIKRYLKP
ncbi:MULTISPECIES: hypothetical protein [unclassified Polaribacter]|uniref:hypothetical protein n=1 Tax=unclassified Polaribacter TaxID=196858 RepID=UPI0011BED697|nr:MULTISPECIES: hypothetical protein [unclassified Polaribacter]TXD51393.1 hypothetical protein ES043_12210 [Polaribacter sp. IC063]TXD62302.1 hypothetical protein ES044_02030 [Polaribacter sp. IC066]